MAFHHSAARASIPDWVFDLTNRIHIPFLSPYLRKTIGVYEALDQMCMKAVSEVRADVLERSNSTTGGALLRNLVKANMDVDGEQDEKERGQRSLTDRELVSNMFLFFIAGHETTANTLSFVCAFLALYPDVQQKILEEVKLIWPNGVPEDVEEAEYKNTFSRLTYTTAVFYEALRLIPIVSRLGRMVLKDTVLRTYRLNGVGDPEPYSVPMKEGSEIIIDMAAVHRNPIYWGADADDFKPERFVDTDTYRWPRDAFLAFSTGFRDCIGRRFAAVEGANVIARIIRRYEILVPKHLKDMPFEEQKAYLLKWRPFVSNSPVYPEVTFRKRS
ncbi:cytochrome P450 [Dendrothele bispora CBS 962.96]|uniref:Cytochrome P450 n=1 Tax=Dendrothele bispora (strain CBS 962.96) TaxID=1314807 RepID=A0A4S8KJ87_DENBC|nr:cytochrome P450 [Dendrothele bispora CBS 962.96]